MSSSLSTLACAWFRLLGKNIADIKINGGIMYENLQLYVYLITKKTFHDLATQFREKRHTRSNTEITR